jgi:UDP-N-acetylmuramoyl-tripeptide--D-alanyl-D-alanine ligase
MLTLSIVVEALTKERPPDLAHVITDAVIDSRQAIPGALFVALAGERQDGHDFIGDAFARGASLALIQRDVPSDFRVLDLRGGCRNTDLEGLEVPFCIRTESSLHALQEVAGFWRKQLDVRVIGITGSVGKTTTKEVIAEIMGRRWRTLKNPGNLNNEIGLPLTLLHLTEGHEVAVLEMGFYVPGEIALLCQLASPQVGVVTNIGTVHAERAGSQQAIARGKAELVRALPEDGVAILNLDDPFVRAMADETQARVFYYGLDPAADIWADNVVGLGLDGIRFRLHYRKETLHIKVPLIGRHSVHTALRAAAVGLVFNLPWQDILEGLRFGQTQLRLVAVRTESGALLLDDTYNASPESTLAALNLLDELEGRKVAVLGDMLELGPYERTGHEMVGVRASEVADLLVTIGERGHLIAESARNLNPALEIEEFEESVGALEFLKPRLSSGDAVLIKGSRGMNMDIIVSSLEEI